MDDDATDTKYQRLTFPAGAILLKEGEFGDCAYVIVDGWVEIRIGQSGPRPKTIGSRRRGDVIGEMALLDGKPHMASAVAMEETVVNAMPRDEFRRRLESMDPVMRAILKMMSDRMREMAGDVKADGRVSWPRRET